MINVLDWLGFLFFMMGLSITKSMILSINQPTNETELVIYKKRERSINQKIFFIIILYIVIFYNYNLSDILPKLGITIGI